MLETVLGQPSFRIESDLVEAYVTELGGHVAPVRFKLDGRVIEPLSIAPWAEEHLPDEPAIHRSLRGDFFCMPFGVSDIPFQGERHPLHGQTANGRWQLGRQNRSSIELSLDTTIRKAHIEKQILLRDGHSALYSRHVISGATGPMTIGHHAMIKFQSPGVISTSPFGFGQVYPVEFEEPTLGGRTSFEPGARFDDLTKVPKKGGGTADLTRYPARDGFEDLAIIYSERGCFAWNAVCFPEEGYCWFSLRDPRVLTGTIFWISNGGRPYAPWNGRHRSVMGIEDVTAAMLGSLAGSVAENDASREGYKTFLELDPLHPMTVSTIMGVAEIPNGFERVEDLRPVGSGIELQGKSGTIQAPIDLGWLNS